MDKNMNYLVLILALAFLGLGAYSDIQQSANKANVEAAKLAVESKRLEMLILEANIKEKNKDGIIELQDDKIQAMKEQLLEFKRPFIH